MAVENKVEELEERIRHLEGMISVLVGSDRYTVQRDFQMLDGRNIILAKSTGTQIGTETTQKLGFFAATPVTQQTAPSATTVTGIDEDATARSAVNTLRTALINLGLIA